MLFSVPAFSAQSTSSYRKQDRHPNRFALQCEMLENRQLLSTGPVDLVAASASTPLPIDQAALTPNGPAVALSSGAIAVAAIAPSDGTSFSQLSYLLDELAPTSVPAPFQAAGISMPEPLGTSPINFQAAQTAANLTVTNLSVTVLNPDMTSSTAAIVDTQVDSDAYLVPSSPDLLRDHLGQSTAPLATHSNTAATISSNPVVPRSPVASNATPAVTIGGPSLSAQSDVNPPNSETLDFVSPSQAQSGTSAGQTPSTSTAPQSAPQATQSSPSDGTPSSDSHGEQAPSSGAATQPAAPDSQSPTSSGTGSQSTPQAETTPSPGSAQLRPSPALNEAVVDAALETTNVGIPMRSPGGAVLQVNDKTLANQPTESFSSVLSAAAIATTAYNLVMRRSVRSLARWAPRWSGAERPTKRKTG